MLWHFFPHILYKYKSSQSIQLDFLDLTLAFRHKASSQAESDFYLYVVDLKQNLAEIFYRLKK